MARESGYDDFSFALQALDNSSTIGEVDPHLLKSWAKDGEIEHYRQSEAVAYLFQSIVDLQLHGERAEFNNHDNPKDKIIIHKSTTSFVAQFSIDVRDNANRPAVILCFGRMPRVAYERGGDRGLYRLQKFLKSQGIKWTESINKRYLSVYDVLAKTPQVGSGLFGLKLRLPRLPSRGSFVEDEPVIKLGGASQKPTRSTHSAGEKDAAFSDVEEKLSTETTTSSDISDSAIPIASASDDVSQAEDSYIAEEPAETGSGPVFPAAEEPAEANPKKSFDDLASTNQSQEERQAQASDSLDDPVLEQNRQGASKRDRKK